MKCEQKLYQTADRKKLVGEGDKRAAFLYATPGDEIPESAAQLYGLKEGKLPASKPQKPDGDKGGKVPADKGGKPARTKPKKAGGKKAAEGSNTAPPAPPSVALVDIAGIGEATAAALTKAGIADAAALAAVDPQQPPALEGFSGTPAWEAWIEGATAAIPTPPVSEG